jgi:nucleoid-associated protein YgaU
MKKKYRVKSQRRFTIFLALLAILIITTATTAFGFNNAEALTRPVYTEIQIQNGDTLWDLAKAYGPKDQDIRKVVYAICEINEIHADELQAGQVILIPKYL